jgi:small GTP-binding protein
MQEFCTGGGFSDSITVKTILLGDSGVGKSSITSRFTNDQFSPYVDSTIGADYHSKTIHIVKQQEEQENTKKTSSPPRPVTFTIWDTAGQEKFHSLMPMYYRGAQVAILVFDLTKPHTMTSLTAWVEELRSKSPSTMILAICGNKADLEEERGIPSMDGEQWAETVGALYMEVSAKDATNVQELFRRIGTRVVQHHDAAAVDTSCAMLVPSSCGAVDLSDDGSDGSGGGCC